MASLRGVAAPRGLPPAVREQLVTAVQKAAADPEFQAKAAAYFAPLRYLAPAAYADQGLHQYAFGPSMWVAPVRAPAGAGGSADAIAGGAAADLIVVLKDAADDETVGVAGDAFLQSEIEAVADEDVITVDEREGAAGDVSGEGIPGVGLGVFPLEELAGDVGLVAELLAPV